MDIAEVAATLEQLKSAVEKLSVRVEALSSFHDRQYSLHTTSTKGFRSQLEKKNRDIETALGEVQMLATTNLDLTDKVAELSKQFAALGERVDGIESVPQVAAID